jgi:hypothetical protein
MTRVQLAAGLAAAVLAFAAMPQARADVYDYGYGPVYGSYPVISGATCPNGQCGAAYSSPSYSTSSYSTPSYSTGYSTYSTHTCPNGSCGTCPNGSCGLRGQCSGGQCTSGQCSGGQCSDGTCRSGRCGTCPNGDCQRGNCSGNCPNGQCTTRYRGPIDPLSRPDAPSYDRPDYGTSPSALGRPTYSSERPSYRDYRDEPVSRRTWRSDPRPTHRDSDLESPFYN